MTTSPAPRPIADGEPYTLAERTAYSLRLEADVRLIVDRQRTQARVERTGWLIAHPPATRHATPGELAEYRHLLYDADEDASVPAFPYPTQPAEEA